MKALFTAAPAALLVGGCVNGRQTKPQGQTMANPQGTDVGTSFPGVNQPTTTTTATRSDSPPQ